jgi:hypothetical protein
MPTQKERGDFKMGQIRLRSFLSLVLGLCLTFIFTAVALAQEEGGYLYDPETLGGYDAGNEFGMSPAEYDQMFDQPSFDQPSFDQPMLDDQMFMDNFDYGMPGLDVAPLPEVGPIPMPEPDFFEPGFGYGPDDYLWNLPEFNAPEADFGYSAQIPDIPELDYLLDDYLPRAQGVESGVDFVLQDKTSLEQQLDYILEAAPQVENPLLEDNDYDSVAFMEPALADAPALTDYFNIQYFYNLAESLQAQQERQKEEPEFEVPPEYSVPAPQDYRISPEEWDSFIDRLPKERLGL